MSQIYLLPCSCGQKVRVANSQAGGQVTCVCGRSLGIPTLRDLKALELAPEERKNKPARAWNRIQGAIFASGLFLAAIGGTLIGYYLLKYAQLRTSGMAQDRSSDFAKAMTAQIDTLTPVQALELWTPEIKAEGLGEAHPPFWVTARVQIANYLWWIELGVGAIFAGLLISTVALFASRPSG
jgi:hypothetical protein